MNDPVIESVIRYLRGQKLPTRSDDPRMWAEHLESVILPQLDELDTLKARKKEKAAA